MTAYDLQTVANPSLIKRFSHRARYDAAVRLLVPPDGSTLLDYGTGDALLLSLLCRAYPQARYIGYEPVPEMSAQARHLLTETGSDAQLLTTHAQLRGLRCERIACMEVLEHLDETRLAAVFADFRELLAADGRLVISVPIEIGLAALAKNLVRLASRQAQESTSLRNIVAASLGRTSAVPRIGRGGYIASHLGFDHRVLRARLQREGFVVEQQRYAPLPWLGPVLNSQVFWICRRR